MGGLGAHLGDQHPGVPHGRPEHADHGDGQQVGPDVAADRHGNAASDEGREPGQPYNPLNPPAHGRPIRGAAVDSRRVVPGNLFVALPGERTDGHEHLAQAVANGAAAVLVSRPGLPTEALGAVSVIRVGRPLDALGAIAAGWRNRFEPLTVGITGSIAKTSTKEAVADVLAVRFRTRRSEGNENNEIGLPLTVLGLERSDQALVLEMGMYSGGEIADLARIGRPQIGWRTLGSRDFMRVPSPAARMMARVRASVGWGVMRWAERRGRRAAVSTSVSRPWWRSARSRPGRPWAGRGRRSSCVPGVDRACTGRRPRSLRQSR